jgi:hypothetical protein
MGLPPPELTSTMKPADVAATSYGPYSATSASGGSPVAKAMSPL